ncbi:T9SS type A sorting domain-containing protein [Flavobacteriales bacterium]|nr:T9SS type A sorting domain-containing protein [Flavobacteriales bacterium]
MKRILLSIVSILSLSALTAQCSELFISEYVEGWSNNKAIEIVNPTSASIDLSSYELRRYSNGSSTADPSTKRIALSGNLAAYSVKVYVIDKRDSTGTGQEAPVWDTLQNQADEFICPNYTVNNVMYFNGNDAIALFKGIDVIDVFGKVGEDPGTVNGVTSTNKAYGWPLISVSSDSTAWTKDHVLVRKWSVTQGDVNALDAFDPRTEWDSLSPLNFSNLGTHKCNCGTLAGANEIEKAEKFNIFPNPSSTGLITIKASSIPTTVSVFSILGEIVEETNTESTTIRINTSKLTKGIYFISLSFENGQKITKKIVLN